VTTELQLIIIIIIIIIILFHSRTHAHTQNPVSTILFCSGNLSPSYNAAGREGSAWEISQPCILIPLSSSCKERYHSSTALASPPPPFSRGSPKL